MVVSIEAANNLPNFAFHKAIATAYRSPVAAYAISIPSVVLNHKAAVHDP